MAAGCHAQAAIERRHHVRSARFDGRVASLAPRESSNQATARKPDPTREPEVRLVEGRPAQPPRTTARNLFDATVEISSSSGTRLGRCLGVMVAPRVALTAGHCVDSNKTLTVRAVTTSTKSVEVERFWVDSEATAKGNLVDTTSSDVAILLLAKPVVIPFYPSYTHRPLVQDVDATGIRNASDGLTLQSLTFTLGPAPLTPRYYSTEKFSKPGDSGGPVFVVEGEEHVVAGVLAGGGKADSIFARVDVVARTLDTLIASTRLIDATKAESDKRASAPKSPAQKAPR